MRAFRLAAVARRHRAAPAMASIVWYCACAPPVIPAIIDRTADAHEMLSSSLDARVHRFIYDRPPADRSGSPRLVALTFDDGPYPVETPLLLDVLGDLHVPATFFLIGRDAEQFPAADAAHRARGARDREPYADASAEPRCARHPRGSVSARGRCRRARDDGTRPVDPRLDAAAARALHRGNRTRRPGGRLQRDTVDRRSRRLALRYPPQRWWRTWSRTQPRRRSSCCTAAG